MKLIPTQPAYDEGTPSQPTLQGFFLLLYFSIMLLATNHTAVKVSPKTAPFAIMAGSCVLLTVSALVSATQAYILIEKVKSRESFWGIEYGRHLRYIDG